ncbi:MAG: hypothetical protein ACOVRN_12855 [Flavobacterium sp.]
MADNTRKINIDLETLKIPSGNKTRRKRDPADEEKKIRVRTPPKAQNKSLKRNLLKFIRNQQDQKIKSVVSDEPLDLEFKSDFKESLEYLSDVAKKNDIPKMSYNKTLKNFDGLPPPPIPVPVLNDLAPTITPSGAPFNLPQPKYGCLKGGKLPLYKQYTRRQYDDDPQPFKMAPVFKPPPSQVQIPVQTQEQINIPIQAQMPIQIPAPAITQAQPTLLPQTPPSLMPSPNINLDKINIFKGMSDKLTISDLYKPKQPNKRRKTLRRTYKIGKSKNTPKVSVLISNKTIRNQISNKSQMLKQTPIHDIKKYLIKNGFIKVGSIAPNDVLRKMYETAMLACGEIHNYSPDNLVYNFFNAEPSS